MDISFVQPTAINRQVKFLSGPNAKIPCRE
jgi:hypothetical protein